MITTLIHTLPFADRIVISRLEAASMTGSSASYFDKLVRLKLMPGPLPFPGVKRWDKREIVKALDAGRAVSDSSSSMNSWDEVLN